MNRVLILPLIALAFFFTSCAGPVSYTNKPLLNYDQNTKYRVDDHPDGFTVTMSYSRYQFIPESNAVALSAKSNLMALCHEVADSKGRKIDPIDEQRIRMSMGRNGFTGITSWNGTARAFYR
jgi:hypothetical protein